MFLSKSHDSSSEEASSETETTSLVASYGASKETTTDFWYDVKNDPGQLQEQTEFLDKTKEAITKERRIDNDIDDDDSDSDNGADNQALIKSINDIYIDGGSNEELQNITSTGNNILDSHVQDDKEQQISKEWEKPHFDADPKLRTIIKQTTTLENKDRFNIPSSSSSTNIGQSVAESLPSNDQKTIENSVCEQRNTWANSLASKDSTDFDAKSASNDNGGEENFVASTHIQYQFAGGPSKPTKHAVDTLTQTQSNLTSDDSISIESTFNVEKKIPEESNPDVKPWVNSHASVLNKEENKLTTENRSNLDYSFASKFIPKENTASKQDSISLLQNRDTGIQILSSQTSAHSSCHKNTAEKSGSTTDDTRSTSSSTESRENSHSANNEYDISFSRKQNIEYLDSSSSNDNKSRTLITPWINSYGKDGASKTSTSGKEEDKTWVNPYWKDGPPKTSTSGKEEDKTWENPYWKDGPPKISTSGKEEDKTWVNPYKKDGPPKTSTSGKEEDKTWENPYWKDGPPKTSTSGKEEDKTWENPYWKDGPPKTSTSGKEEDKTWENPYWKDGPPKTSTSGKEEDKTWENPYWKDGPPKTSTSGKEEDKTWENPYWKDGPPKISTSRKEEEKTWVNPYKKDGQPKTSTSGKEEDKTWENPYWKDGPPKISTSGKEENKTWENPYWKDGPPKISTSGKEEDKTWENPYWKDGPPKISTSGKEEDKTWENPYWKDGPPKISTSRKEEDKTWENPYWKDGPPKISTSGKEEDKTWENPYWKDGPPKTSTSRKEEDKTWENPYWKDGPPKTSTSGKEDKTWENPYWKDGPPKTSTSGKEEDKTWENPYWKDGPPKTSTSGKEEDKTWENPYWKDGPPTTSTSTKKEGKPWVNSYWKDTKPESFTEFERNQGNLLDNFSLQNNNSTVFTATKQGDSKGKKQTDKPWEDSYWSDKNAFNCVPLSTSTTSSKPANYSVLNGTWQATNASFSNYEVPSFYERIFPIDQPTLSVRMVTKDDDNQMQDSEDLKQLSLFDTASEEYDQDKSDDDSLPFTIDNQGIAHYRSLQPTSVVPKDKTVTFGVPSSLAQNMVTIEHTNRTTSSDQTEVVTSKVSRSDLASCLPITSKTVPSSPTSLEMIRSLNFPNVSSSSSNNYPSSNNPSGIVITFEELCDVQNALRLLETNPNAIPTVETSQNSSTANVTNEEAHYSSWGSSLTDHKNHRSTR